MAEPVCVGVVDSGWAAELGDRVQGARSFVAEGGDINAQDRIGHGSRVLQAIAALAPDARFCVAQVFGEQLRTDGETVALALDWLVDQGAAVVNLSLGVRQDRAPLRAACERALDRGCVVVASTPARGEPVFPAAYPGVIRVMGDARCAPGQHSALLLPHADFGACVLPPGGDRAQAGASMGSAHLSGHVAALMAAGVTRERSAIWQALVDSAAFHGPERRTS
ncbi:S8 family serine peptidase [Hydrogenophaga sp.]|jgi:subtilisin family serine protease|uniref:subtilisin-like serine protease QhpE n=1 Tax=Hydrogenophaga sp. TaxID=1904254 RepID=UPI002725BD33|nr:S8 family serine peptidase [Hydrogenophaga sp.]MDO9253777.1 S8 family serine peptidase [Hydrogenophaga sp.]MDP3324641.1 S8 family serine peptidase [Hydrogenophaga sp.]MDP3887734.1 S8 family serine peptidase [Hydrogenophaga sp.]MDZ4356791.1 S8 family serine peptidase [Variovorax sp.]